MSTTDRHDETPSRILADLLAFSAEQSDLGRAFARHMHMRPTDATAIVEILRAEDAGRPLTPARLGERISMTSGATTILLNRLEDAGHITRVRGHADRRVVTLHSVDHIHAEAEAFFEPERRRLLARIHAFGASEQEIVRQFTSGLSSNTSDAVVPEETASGPDARS
ncbi:MULTISPECIES: MarR family winged helix-turn-helix transcriptional regulator [unclassified Curtobacterium]|uniref:MarR family winged helix-turn-helix transcriptional regulator n=1 Tax=unclassified Curtobacterium TaxID=257496 RepID=UPI00188A6933|nr:MULTISPECIES: MarR family winged helix-turn-helix transcriptional regulator [unclassified Curtobacterium]MBF4591720.1 winged helix-turn-helix transcriptional regulator [Curtobacterium sp. VKM Ac-1395]MCY1692955.1 MarR family winged helix-turn-helix transcriptional regulator [Curtobacterium sp. SL109]